MLQRDITNYLPQHRSHMLEELPLRLPETKHRQVIRFLYGGRERFVLVVHANWEQKLHALDLRMLPRKALLRVLNTPEQWNELQLYREVVDRPEVRKWDAYRTYDRRKLTGLRQVSYDNTLQPDEQDEQGIEQPEAIQAVEREAH